MVLHGTGSISFPSIPGPQGWGLPGDPPPEGRSSGQGWQDWIHCSWKKLGHLERGDVSFPKGSAVARRCMAWEGRKEEWKSTRRASHPLDFGLDSC